MRMAEVEQGHGKIQMFMDDFNKKIQSLLTVVNDHSCSNNEVKAASAENVMLIKAAIEAAMAASTMVAKEAEVVSHNTAICQELRTNTEKIHSTQDLVINSVTALEMW